MFWLANILASRMASNMAGGSGSGEKNTTEIDKYLTQNNATTEEDEKVRRLKQFLSTIDWSKFSQSGNPQ